MPTPSSAPKQAKNPVIAPIGGIVEKDDISHDLQHQIGLVREALRSEKRRLGFFLGAGCPLGIYNEEGTGSLKYIPDVAGLTATIQSELAADKELSSCWDKLSVSCKTDDCPVPNVEHILTQLRTICALRGSSMVDGMSVDTLRDLDLAICGKIVGLVGKSLPRHKNAYHRFAAWVRHLERTYGPRYPQARGLNWGVGIGLDPR